MAVSVPAVSRTPGTATSESDFTRAFATEWPIYAVLIASVSIVIGLIWDISWHRTIGRDTFWSPPHLLEQGGAIISGLSCGYLALKTTFAGTVSERANSVRFWRFFQAPVGAWVCIWGTLMMIISAPFDEWWHRAYGLDVTIISAPHMVLASGMVAIQLGAMLMALGAQNRAESDSDRKRLGVVFSLSASVIVLMVCVIIMEDAAYANEMHGSQFYKITGMVIPVFLIAFARASRLSWPATRIAIVYMLVLMVSIWVLQLVPATPKLAPIYNPVTRMVPPPFPLLLFAPALLIDIIMNRFGDKRDWTLSLILGTVFVGTMVTVHWYWARFLVSPAARNYFFGADLWDYTRRLGSWRYEFWNSDLGPTGQRSIVALAIGLAIAVAYATVSVRVGLAWGKGMSRIKR